MFPPINESRENMAAEFAALGLGLKPHELEKFWLLHCLLREKNQALDLTRVKNFTNILYRHYIDGAMAAKLIAPKGLLMDLGTGAGFPGLPLAILRPDWPLLLAEPRGRRLAFMEEAVALLGLRKVEFYPHKVGPRFDRPIQNLITRDFEAAPLTLSRAALIIPPGGRVYLMKGKKADAELREAEALSEWNDFELEDDRAYTLGRSGLDRRLITWRKKDCGRRPKLEGGRPYRLVEIASRENPRYKNWLKSLSGRGLKKSGQAIISGRKFVAEILKGPLPPEAALIIKGPDNLSGLGVPDEMTVYQARPELFPALDIFGAGPPLMVFSPPEPAQWDGRLAEDVTVFLPFQDPANLGAAIRTAAALGAAAVILKEAASPWHPKSLRAAGPAVFLANLQSGPGLSDLAGLENPGLLALSPTGRNILDYPLPPKAGFVFGLEGPGLFGLWPPGRSLSIPMRGGVESMNAAAALAALLGILAGRRGQGSASAV